MLEFTKNGERIILRGIYNHGNIGHSVILGERVDWGKKPDPIKYPLSQYPCPTIFTIVNFVEKKSEEFSYILKDDNGNCIELPCKDCDCLYDAQEWLTWNAMREAEENSCKQREIKHLKDHEELLKDILTKQGIRIVTEEQAKELGL